MHIPFLKNSHNGFKARLSGHIAAMLFGFTGVLGVIISCTELTLVWYRLFFASLILLFFPFVRRQLLVLSWKTLWKLSYIGILAALHWVSFYGSIKIANASVALVCLATVPFLTAIIEPLRAKEKIDTYEITLGVICLFGIGIIFFSGKNIALMGILVGIISALLAAIFSILNKEISRQCSVHLINVIEFSAGWIFLSLLIPVYYAFSPNMTMIITEKDLLYIFLLALVFTVLPVSLELFALRYISAFSVNLIIALEPIYGIVLAWLLLGEGEQFDRNFYLGVIVIVIAHLFHIKHYRAKQHSQSSLIID